MMNIEDVMNKNVITLKPEMTIREAYEVFVKNNISGAPVVGSNGKLIGILTVKDILKIIKVRMENIGVYVLPTPFDFMDTPPIEIPLEYQETYRNISNIKVEEVMERKVHYVRPDMNIYNALDILVKKDISRLPVVDKDKR